MASLKWFSLTHVVIALIFGFILISSLADAGRTIDGVVPQDRVPNINCRILRDVCNQSKECTSQCKYQSFNDGTCIPYRLDPLGNKHCCCY
ncbi:hypothetical protein MKX03_017978 [Papaver bracteatum]|nr:hypothetical protein MKX03_017978 [Papaver bracteatum]